MKIIPFSGSCLSGKTTTIYYLKNLLEKEGFRVKIAEEPIREILNELKISIDDLRNNVDYFLLVQKKVLEKRIENEIKIVTDLHHQREKYDYLFIDRSAADVFFYVTFYLDKKLLLTEKQTRDYKNLLLEINEYVKKSSGLYDKIFLFEPLKKIIINDDSYRPKNISEEKKYLEYELIKLYTHLFFNQNYIVEVDMNKENEPNKLFKILKYL